MWRDVKNWKALFIRKASFFWVKESVNNYITTDASSQQINLEDEFYLTCGEFNNAKMSMKNFNNIHLNCLVELGYNVPEDGISDVFPKLDNEELKTYVTLHYDTLKEEADSVGDEMFAQSPADTKVALANYYGKGWVFKSLDRGYNHS